LNAHELNGIRRVEERNCFLFAQKYIRGKKEREENRDVIEERTYINRGLALLE